MFLVDLLFASQTGFVWGSLRGPIYILTEALSSFN